MTAIIRSTRISQFYDDLRQQQFTQELQLLGESFNDRLKWIVGLYYFTEDGDNRNELDFTVSRFRSGGAFDNESMAAFAQGTSMLPVVCISRPACAIRMKQKNSRRTRSFMKTILKMLRPDHPN